MAVYVLCSNIGTTLIQAPSGTCMHNCFSSKRLVGCQLFQAAPILIRTDIAKCCGTADRSCQAAIADLCCSVTVLQNKRATLFIFIFKQNVGPQTTQIMIF